MEEVKIVLRVVLEENGEVQEQEHHAEDTCRELVEVKDCLDELDEQADIRRDKNADNQGGSERERR